MRKWQARRLQESRLNLSRVVPSWVIPLTHIHFSSCLQMVERCFVWILTTANIFPKIDSIYQECKTPGDIHVAIYVAHEYIHSFSPRLGQTQTHTHTHTHTFTQNTHTNTHTHAQTYTHKHTCSYGYMMAMEDCADSCCDYETKVCWWYLKHIYI